jgi:ABC-type sugar transport system substrate-binding protein
MRKRTRATTALAAALATVMCVPAIAQAAKVTVTGDAGSPVALTPGADEDPQHGRGAGRDV